MPKITLSNTQLYYEIHGEGPPLIMIMGWCGNKDWWSRDYLTSLSKKFKIIIFDNRGAGRSKQSRGLVSIKLLAKDTLELINKLNISKVNVIGVSMGGMIAQELAILAPDRVDKLILGCTNCGLFHGKIISKTSIKLWKSLLHEKKRMTKKLFINYLLFSKDISTTEDRALIEFKENIKIAPINNKDRYKQLLACLLFNSYKRLPEIKNPTLIVTGKNDALIAPENSKILNKRMPNSQIITFEDLGHCFFVESKKIAQTTINFLLEQKNYPGIIEEK